MSSWRPSRLRRPSRLVRKCQVHMHIACLVSQAPPVLARELPLCGAFIPQPSAAHAAVARLPVMP